MTDETKAPPPSGVVEALRAEFEQMASAFDDCARASRGELSADERLEAKGRAAGIRLCMGRLHTLALSRQAQGSGGDDARVQAAVAALHAELTAERDDYRSGWATAFLNAERWLRLTRRPVPETAALSRTEAMIAVITPVFATLAALSADPPEGETSQIERVARAICRSEGVDPDETCPEGMVMWRYHDSQALAAIRALAAAPPVSAEEGWRAFAVTEELVDYIGRYGGRCRDCADENGVCPLSGLPCGGSHKAIRHVLRALSYGVKHGYVKLTPPPAGGSGNE